jgi:hypothetical protein
LNYEHKVFKKEINNKKSYNEPKADLAKHINIQKLAFAPAIGTHLLLFIISIQCLKRRPDLGSEKANGVKEILQVGL